MAIPQFSPSTGPGTSYTDPSTGITYVFQSNGSWSPTSSGVNQTPPTQPNPQPSPIIPNNTTQSDPFQSALDTITSSIAKANAPTNPSITPQKIDFSALKVPEISTYEQQIAKDPTFVAYYQKLFNDAQGDINEAMRRMEYDYTTGNRRITEDTTRKTEQEQQDFQAALAKLGLTTGAETRSLLDTENKRGIALTQSNPGQALTVAGEGQGGTEMGQLKADQALRQEALQRNSERNITELGLTKTRTLADIGEKQTETTADINKSARDTQKSLAEQQQQDLLQRAQLAQSQAAATRSNTLQEATLKAQGIAIPG